VSDLICANTISEAALAIATTQVGVRESGGQNRGPEVELYLAAAGGEPGESWCAAFLYWCFRRASNVLMVPNPCPRTVGAQNVYKLAEPRFRRTSPARGAIFVMDHGHGLGHVGFVDTAYPDGTISTVEGNTNRDGARNGDSVWRHGPWNPLDGKRGILMGYVDLADAVALPASAAPVS
jgi:hypothetical protein